MRLSLLICSRNRTDHLQATLRSVAGLIIPSGTFVEVVLVDNESTDATNTVLPEFQAPGFSVRTVSQPERKTANARHAGVQAVNGEVLGNACWSLHPLHKDDRFHASLPALIDCIERGVYPDAQADIYDIDLSLWSDLLSAAPSAVSSPARPL